MEEKFQFKVDIYRVGSVGDRPTWHWMIRDGQREYASWVVGSSGKQKTFETRAAAIEDLAAFMPIYLRGMNATENLQPYATDEVAAEF